MAEQKCRKKANKKAQIQTELYFINYLYCMFITQKEFNAKTQQQIINQMIFFRLKSSLCLSITLFIIINLCLHINTIEISTIQSLKQDVLTDSIDLQDQKICDGNVFEYLSSFVLGRQNDLTKTFAEIQKHISLKNITYSDKVGKLYKIYNFKPHLLYLQSKQVAQVKSLNLLNISGGSVKLTYDFQWEKQQLGSSIKGNGSGLVSSDPITFQKILETNENHQLEWVFTKALPITIQNSLTLSKFTPYKELDYEIINQMLNQLKNNETTVKKELIAALNFNFTNILKGVVKQDETITIPKQIKYTYLDYRGQFEVLFDNVLLQNSLSKSGLSLLLSRVIRDYKNFECGAKVPDQPQSQSKYGGTQQYISNQFLKSTLKYALQNHFLDVTLSQVDWQSRAFQFYVGDLHEAISSTKNTSSFIELTGKCQGIDDKSFSFQKKTISSYAVMVNFTCFLLQNTTKIIDIVLPVEYEVAPVLKSSELNFVIKSIKGSPLFIESQKYKITNPDLAQFMLTQTLNMAVNSSVIGSHFKTRARKTPQHQVRDGYLFLYDKSTINSNRQDL